MRGPATDIAKAAEWDCRPGLPALQPELEAIGDADAYCFELVRGARTAVEPWQALSPLTLEDFWDLRPFGSTVAGRAHRRFAAHS